MVGQHIRTYIYYDLMRFTSEAGRRAITGAREQIEGTGSGERAEIAQERGAGGRAKSKSKSKGKGKGKNTGKGQAQSSERGTGEVEAEGDTEAVQRVAGAAAASHGGDGLSRFDALMLTFLISNLLHEWIVTFAMGCFYPILFLMFGGPGVFFAQLKTARGTSSTFVWMMLIVGTGLLLVLYAREWYARYGCHRLPDALLPEWLHAGTVGSVVVPRSVLAYLYSGVGSDDQAE